MKREIIKLKDLDKSNSYPGEYTGRMPGEIRVPNEWIVLMSDQKMPIKPDDMYYNPDKEQFKTVKLYDDNDRPIRYVFQIRRRIPEEKRLRKKCRTIGKLGIDFKTIIKKVSNNNE